MSTSNNDTPIHRPSVGGEQTPSNVRPVPEKPAPTPADFGGFGNRHQPINR